MELNPPIKEIEAMEGDTVLNSCAFMPQVDLRNFVKLVWGFDWREAEKGLLNFNGKVNISGFIRESKKLKGAANGGN